MLKEIAVMILPCMVQRFVIRYTSMSYTHHARSHVH